MAERVLCTIDNGVADVRLDRPDKLNALDGAMRAAVISGNGGLNQREAAAASLEQCEPVFHGWSPPVTDLVLADLDADGVLTLTLNRPERRNSWNDDLKDAYYDRLTVAAADPDVRVAVVTGAGTTFCPGADTSRLDRLATEGAELPHVEVDAPRNFPKPIIAAINGACAGVGLVHALFCHVRFAAESARFATSFARRGLVAEYGIAWTLPRLIGVENAMDLLLSGRTFDAAEAKELGLVSRVVPRDDVLAAAQSYARDLARNCSPAAMSVIAGQVTDALDVSFGEALESSYAHVDRFIGGPDLREGLASFLEKRPPRFEPMGQGS